MKEAIARGIAGETLARGNDWRNGTSESFAKVRCYETIKAVGGSSSKRPWIFRLTIQNSHKRGHPEAPGGREASRAKNALVEGEARWRILQGE